MEPSAPALTVVGVIPARFASSRFPGKPLARIAGKPMILHVAERADAARRAGVFDRLLIATDDERIRRVVEAAGFEVAMTSPDHPTGTDRLAEVAQGLDAELVCNIQGDEPLVETETLAALVRPLLEDPALPMGSLKTELTRPADRFDRNRGKVVVDARDRALTFTRLPILEDVGEGETYFNRARVEAEHAARGLRVYSDIGVYAYRRDFLLRYPALERTPFEQAEQLEQLRALEHGFEISVPTVSHRGLEVDTPEDLARVERELARSTCA
ncbi:MAG: 3-deoxy-manno-octulosonate cytidylyltransferase [Myxococcota bacterium]